MPKRNAKINNNDNLLPPQTRSLRSRKSKSQSDESVLTDDDRRTLSQKDTEDDTGSVAMPLQCPLQECAITIKQQAAELSCLSDQDGLTKEKRTEMTNVNITNVAVAGQEDTNPSSDSQVETCGVNTETDTKKSEKNREEAGSRQQESKLPNQTNTDGLQVLKDDDKSTVLEKQMYAKRNLNLEKNQDRPSTCTSDAEESTAGLPAKKKQRTGSHYLQNQMCENWPNGTESAEKQIYDKLPKSVALEEEIPSASASVEHASADCITERSEAEPQNRHHRISCEHRAETEVQIAVATSDGTSILCDPEVKTSWPVPELTDNLAVSHKHAEKKERLENQQLQEHKAEHTAENRAEKSENPMEAGEGESAEVSLRSTSQMEESDNKSEGEAGFLQMRSGNKTGDEKKGCMTDDGVTEAVSSAHTQTGSSGCGVKTLCEALLIHTVQEVKTNCDPKDDCAPGSSAGCTWTGVPDDTFGFGCSDYVSDSQLNTIVLVDEKMTEKDEPDLSVHLEDATDLICGLIGELSSLNQKVMVAHRQLENLRCKNPKGFPR